MVSFCSTLYRIMRFLGLPTLPDKARPMKEMVEREVRVAESNPQVGSDLVSDGNFLYLCTYIQGFFIERFKSVIEEASLDISSTFQGHKGRTQLVGTVMDLFVAGTDTTTTVMEWAVLYLSLFPKIQKQIRKEVVLLKDKILHFVHI